MLNMKKQASAGSSTSKQQAKDAVASASAAQDKSGAADEATDKKPAVKQVNLEHMPQFIKNAPWYMN